MAASLEKWQSVTQDPRVVTFFDGLFEALIGQQSTLAAAALAFNEHDGPVSADLRRRYDAFLTAFEDAVRDRIRAYGLPAEPRLTSRILIGDASVKEVE